MKISVLASGSTGNATYIETPKSKVLVDAGLIWEKDRRIDEFNW